MENLKLITVSLSSNCTQKPKCSFCYQRGNTPYDFWAIYKTVNDLLKENPKSTVCIEYSGYNLSFLSKMHWWTVLKELTMTTMPSVIDPTFCSAIKAWGVSAVALSYDKEKVKSFDQWLAKASIIKEAGLKVSCNLLLGHSDHPDPTLFKGIDQVNLLTPKPTGKISNSTAVQICIEALKPYTRVGLDNCLAVQLGYAKECKRGKDFIHVLPDGSTQDCCFGDWCYLYET